MKRRPAWFYEWTQRHTGERGRFTLRLRALFLLAMGPPTPVAYGPPTCVEWCEGEGGRAAWVRDPDPDISACLCVRREKP